MEKRLSALKAIQNAIRGIERDSQKKLFRGNAFTFLKKNPDNKSLDLITESLMKPKFARILLQIIVLCTDLQIQILGLVARIFASLFHRTYVNCNKIMYVLIILKIKTIVFFLKSCEIAVIWTKFEETVGQKPFFD